MKTVRMISIRAIVRSLLLLLGATVALPCHAQSSDTGDPVSAVAIDPLRSTTLFVGTTHGIYKSTDGGATWIAVKTGVRVFSLAIDPQSTSTVYAVAVADLARPDTTDGVFKTVDGGETWTLLGAGILRNANVVAVDPNPPAGTVYVGTTGGSNLGGTRAAAFKSTDGGTNWLALERGLNLGTNPAHPEYHGFSALTIDHQTSSIYGAIVDRGLSGRRFSVLVIDPNDSSTFYATPTVSSLGLPPLEVRKSSDGGLTWTNPVKSSMLDRFATGVFKTVDGGGTWTAVDVGLPVQQSATALAIDPVNASILYAGLPGGIFKTVNGGLNWTAANSGLPVAIAINVLAVDHTAPATVYAGTDLGIYKSVDSGATWTVANSGLKAGTAPPPPVLSTLSSGTAARDSIVEITFTGTGFVAPLGIDAGNDIAVTNLLVNSTTSVTATLSISGEAVPGSRNIRIAAAGGTSNTLPLNITAVALVAPTLSSISPNSGRQNARVQVTLAGTNFTPSMTVNSGSGVVVTSVNVTSPTSATAVFTIALDADPSSRSVTVLTSGSSSNTVPFTVISLPPDVTNLSPRFGQAGRSMTVRLTGARFVLPLTFSADPDITFSNITPDASGTSATATFTIATDATLGPHRLRLTGVGGQSGAVTFVVKSTTRQFDFNGDGTADLLWYNAATGETAMWLMNGTRVLSSRVILRDPDWKVAFTGDFNGDAKADLLWYNGATGETAMWLMNGTEVLNSAVLFTDPVWKVTVAAEFNGDGKTDLLWSNAVTGQTGIWLMDGTQRLSFSVLYTDPLWKVTASADLNGDGKTPGIGSSVLGKSDLLWYNGATGETVAWLMDGVSRLRAESLFTDPDWKIAATPDVDGDGNADLLWYNASAGETVVWTMSAISLSSFSLLSSDPNWSVTTTADLDGDGSQDLLWHNTATGETVVWLMNGLTPSSSASLLTDRDWTVTTSRDFDGDGKSDLLWYNTATGETAVWLMDGLRALSYVSLLIDPNWRVLSNL